jgi:fumarate reductase flavoprotein subunit
MSTAETNDTELWDLIVVGGGSAGMPAALFAARRGARVLLIDHAPVLGGTLWVATGQMSAAGTKLQRERGIVDSPREHYDDVMRISRGTADPELVRLAVFNAAETFDWLYDLGLELRPEDPVTAYGHEPYLKPRYYWPVKDALAVKDILEPLVHEQAAAGRIDLRLSHEVLQLLTDADGGVRGVEAKDGAGAIHRFHARNIALTCGGYASNPEMYQEITGAPQYLDRSYAYSQGAGLRLGQSVGGYLRGIENFIASFGAALASDSYPTQPVGRLETFPDRRPPWEIYVNARGDRFVREDIPSVDARENALMDQPGRRYWVVFDQAILDAAPPMVIGWTREEMAAAFDAGYPSFRRAETLEALALTSGIDADGLRRAVSGYNYGVVTGHDFFGRVHLPAPIGTGPFYAICQQGSTITSAAGLAVNASLQVIRRDGSPIPGLYAAGEILGAGQTMGRAFCGGMMVTPALTFGRLLGQSIIPLGPAA